MSVFNSAIFDSMQEEVGFYFKYNFFNHIQIDDAFTKSLIVFNNNNIDINLSISKVPFLVDKLSVDNIKANVMVNLLNVNVNIYILSKLSIYTYFNNILFIENVISNSNGYKNNQYIFLDKILSQSVFAKYIYINFPFVIFAFLPKMLEINSRANLPFTQMEVQFFLKLLCMEKMTVEDCLGEILKINLCYIDI